jgi:dethiobiotin synthetase
MLAVAAADWAAAAKIPALVVARTDLGTINHTRMTLEVLAARQIPVIGIILNRVHGGEIGLAERTNPGTLRRLLPFPVWGPVPFVEGVSDDLPPADVVGRLPALPFAEEIAAALAAQR